MNWWVIDNGGGKQVFSGTDTIWASIGQTAIGPNSSGSTLLCAGYIITLGSCVKIEEQPGEDGKPGNRPYVFGINSISPNPFNPTCAIEFEIEKSALVTVEFFDMLGKVINSPVQDKFMTPGKYKLSINGNIPSGTYFIRLTSEGNSVVKRVVCLK
jgi:hypothetical protein